MQLQTAWSLVLFGWQSRLLWKHLFGNYFKGCALLFEEGLKKEMDSWLNMPTMNLFRVPYNERIMFSQVDPCFRIAAISLVYKS